MPYRASRDLDNVATDLSGWRHFETVLRTILEINTDASDDKFHLQLARSLAEALGCHTAFVGQLIQSEDVAKVRTLAVWSYGAPAEDYEYPLDGTACEEVLRTGLLKVDRDVGSRFPKDRILGAIQAESQTPKGTTGRAGGLKEGPSKGPRSIGRG